LFLYIIVSVLLLAAGYLFSVFSNAIYIDPDEIRTLFPALSVGRRAHLEEIISKPRAFMQVAFLVRISAAIALGVVALLMARQIADWRLVPAVGVYLATVGVCWILALICFIYLPRRVSPQEGKSRLLRFLPFVTGVYLISIPAIRLFTKISSRRTGREITEAEKDDIVERAIESLAESAGIESPIIEEDEKEMIHQIFQLDVTEVEEIMVPRIRVIGLEAETSWDQIREMVERYGFSRFPVYTETIDNVIGILNVKDLLILSETERRDFVLTDYIREPLRVGEHKKIDQLLAEFKRHKVHMAIVMDEFGGTAGLVTLEDILEEIVGEIEDEHDTEQKPHIIRQKNGSFEVSGACPLEDLAEELGIETGREEFETVGGLIYDLVGSVPTEGTWVSWEKCRIKVQQIEGQRIRKVLVIPGERNS